MTTAERYRDGGAYSMLNADLASGYESVMVVSCFSVDYAPTEAQAVLNTGLQSELHALRQQGAVVTLVTPGQAFFELTKQGTDMVNPSLMAEAWQTGRHQALMEKDTLASAW